MRRGYTVNDNDIGNEELQENQIKRFLSHKVDVVRGEAD